MYNGHLRENKFGFRRVTKVKFTRLLKMIVFHSNCKFAQVREMVRKPEESSGELGELPLSDCGKIQSTASYSTQMVDFRSIVTW